MKQSRQAIIPQYPFPINICLIIMLHVLFQRKDLEAKLEEGQVFIEFEQVPKKRPRYEVAIASASTNVDRNRFKDVLPYDDNRVKLMPTKDNPQGYINASHIKVN